MVVYFHRNPNNNEVFYVGIGQKKERAYRVDGKHRNQIWHKYVKKHSIIPIVEIVHEFETRAECVEMELKYISEFGRKCDGSGCLVNITIGGDGGCLGMKQTDEHIEKRAVYSRGKKYGEEARLKMKEAQNRPEVKAKHAAIKSDPIWLEKQRQAKIGKKLTEEHKKKISEGNKGRVFDEATREKISQANRGKVRTPEMRKRFSEQRKGRKQTPEVNKKRAEACKKVLLNTQTGIYYTGMKDAADSIQMNICTFRSKLSGHLKNTTPFIYA